MEDQIFQFIMKFFVVILVIIIVMVVAEWRLFQKAGKPGWHSLIPFLNTYDLYEFVWNQKIAYVAMVLSLASSLLSGYSEANEDVSGFLGLIMSLVGIVSLVLGLIALYRLSTSFGHDVGFFVGLLLLSPIFLCILAFGKSQYIGPGGAPSYKQNSFYDPYGSPQNPYGTTNGYNNYEIYGQQNGGYPNQQGMPQQPYGANPFEQNKGGFEANGSFNQQPGGYTLQQDNPFEQNIGNNYNNFQ